MNSRSLYMKMKSKILVSTFAAACLAGGSALAQGYDHHGPQQSAPHHAPPPSHHAGPPVHHAPPHHAAPPHHPVEHHGRGAGPRHSFYKGDHLPREYRTRQYVIDNWRAHHLSAPPHGYYWVQTGGDYVLAAIATGLIAQIVLSN
jgi:Ni/Co efflux regulator RcnB